MPPLEKSLAVTSKTSYGNCNKQIVFVKHAGGLLHVVLPCPQIICKCGSWVGSEILGNEQ